MYQMIDYIGDIDTLRGLLETFTERGIDKASLIVDYSPAQTSELAQQYFLICTDPDGEWFWVNDPHDTGWTMIERHPLEDLALNRMRRLILIGAS